MAIFNMMQFVTGGGGDGHLTVANGSITAYTEEFYIPKSIIPNHPVWCIIGRSNIMGPGGSQVIYYYWDIDTNIEKAIYIGTSGKRDMSATWYWSEANGLHIDIETSPSSSGETVYYIALYNDEAIPGTYQEKTATPAWGSSVSVTPTSPYDALSSVTVNPITTAILQAADADFISSNIKKNVNILGITGSYEGTSSGYGRKGYVSFSNGYAAIVLPTKPTFVEARASDSYRYRRYAYYNDNNGTITCERQNNTDSSSSASWTTLTAATSVASMTYNKYYWDASTNTFYIGVRNSSSASGTCAWVAVG